MTSLPKIFQKAKAFRDFQLYLQVSLFKFSFSLLSTILAGTLFKVSFSRLPTILAGTPIQSEFEEKDSNN